MMNEKRFLAQRGVFNALTAILGLGLLVMLAFSLNALFSSRSQQLPQITRQPGRPSAQQLLFTPTPTASQPEAEMPSPTVVVEQPSPTPTIIVTGQLHSAEEWKTYINTIFDFSIKYPPGWSFSEDTTVAPEDRTIYFYDATRKHAEKQIYLPYEGISIQVRDNNKGLSLEEWAEQLYKEMSGGLEPPESLAKERISIAGYQALRVSQIPSRVTEYFVLISYNRRVLIAGLDSGIEPTGNGQRPKYGELFFRMLKTLHFPQDR